MALEVSIGIAHASVHKAMLRASDARFDAETGLFVCAHPLAPPRLWRQVTDAALGAFFDSMSSVSVSGASVRAAAARAALRVAQLRSQLIETQLMVDTQLGVLAFDGREMHVLLTAGMRVYRARGGSMPERLYPNVQRPEGLGVAAPFQGTETPERGDLLILGTRDAFTVRAIGQLATLMSRDPKLPVSAVCEAVIHPCREAQVGASTIVVRAA